MNRRAVLGFAVLVVLLVAASLSLVRRHRIERSPAPVRRSATVSSTPPAPERASVPPLASAPVPMPPRQFRLDAHHTGRSGFRLPRHVRIREHISSAARITTQAAALSDGSVVFGSQDGIVRAFDPDTGRLRWSIDTGQRVYSSPLVGPGGEVYVGSDSDRMFRLDARGHVQSALATDDDADTSPVMAPDGSLRFAAGRVLFATDADLTVRWRLAFGGKIFSSPAMLDDGSTIIGCQDDSVYAVDPNGSVRWHVPTGDDVDATPTVDGDLVFVGSDDGNVYALATADGQRRWRRNLEGHVRAGIAVGLDGTLVVGSYGPRPRIVGIGRDDGQVRWSLPVQGPPTADYGVASAALVDAEGAYALGVPDDAVWIIDRNGTVRERIPMPAAVDAPPVLIADGVLVVGCDDGNEYVLGE